MTNKQLKHHEDTILALRVKKYNDNDSLIELIKKHTPLCIDVFNKYKNAVITAGLSFEELVSQKDLLIYKAAQGFEDGHKSKFSTWLSNQVRYKCLNYINRNKGRYFDYFESIDDMEKFIHHHNNYLFDFKKEETKLLNNMIEQIDDERIKNILKLRYFGEKKEKTWHFISKKMKMSTQWAIMLHKKGLKEMKKKMKENY